MQQSFLPDEDALYTILADLKRTSGEYTTAVTESNCPVVRRTFTDLLNNSLHQQEQLYQFMRGHNMYNTSSQALRQEVDKQAQQAGQDAQQTQQLLQSRGIQLHPGIAQQARQYPQYEHQRYM